MSHFDPKKSKILSVRFGEFLKIRATKNRAQRGAWDSQQQTDCTVGFPARRRCYPQIFAPKAQKMTDLPKQQLFKLCFFNHALSKSKILKNPEPIFEFVSTEELLLLVHYTISLKNIEQKNAIVQTTSIFTPVNFPSKYQVNLRIAKLKSIHISPQTKI